MNKEDFSAWLANHSEQSLFQGDCPLVMGILNVTPDSFSDGGAYFNQDDAFAKARAMIAAGVDIIDIGGESSRPGAKPLSEQEELDRVVPVIERIRQASDVCLSIDTVKANVMQHAVTAGATMINDIQALQGEHTLATASKLHVPVVLMHMQGKPNAMQDKPEYQNGVVEELKAFFQQRISECLAAGIARQNLILDVGFGFGKTVAHNLHLLQRMSEFKKWDLPLMLGVSRKSTLGAVVNEPVGNRLYAGIGLAVHAAMQGCAIIRTHDVLETLQALRMVAAVYTQ